MRLIDADELKIPSEELIAKMAIAFAPTIDPMRHGRWDKDSIAFYWRCSECGAIVKSNLWDVFLDPFSSHRDLNYCPNCGARMGEKEDEAHRGREEDMR